MSEATPPVQMNELLALITAVLGAVVGAIVAIIYRDYRDRPVLHAEIDELKRARRPIRLPEEVFRAAYPQGTFRNWLDPLVKWEVNRPFEENRFTQQQLRDVLTLSEQFLQFRTERRTRVRHMLESLANPQQPPAPGLVYTMSLVRSYWQEAFHKDIFIEYKDNQAQVIGALRSNFEGDIHQTEIEIQGVRTLHDYLETGFAPTTPPTQQIQAVPEDPQNPAKPYIIIELLVENSGRTDALLRDSAQLRVGNQVFPLQGIGDDPTYDVYAGSFFRTKASSVTRVAFSQDPQNTNQTQLHSLRDLIMAGTSKARIIGTDSRGKKWKTSRFRFREIS